MLRNWIDKQPKNDAEFCQLPLSQTVSSILNFLEKWLPCFSEICLSSPVSHLEDAISEELLYFLQHQAKSNDLLIHFNARKGVDFLIKVRTFGLNAKPLFVIEAKRLPPTKNKDYVQGGTGGIERFKREQEGFDQPLDVSAMLGYVQEKNFTYWYQRINTWIEALIEQSGTSDDIQWDQQDLLVKFSPITNNMARCVSKHSRKTKQDIELYHFWLNMMS